MKTKNQYLAVGAAILSIGALLVLILAIAAPALSEGTFVRLLAATSTPSAPQGDVIPIRPVSDLESLTATVTLNVNGLIDGERAQGDLTGLLTANDQGKSKVTVSGGLMGEIAAQVGGSLVGLFTPSKLDLYKTPTGSYIVAGGLFPICVKAPAGEATAALDDMSPSSMLSMLTSSDVARGEFVGSETLNGVPVKHYVLDGETFLTAAQNSSNTQLRTFGEALWSAEDVDLWVDAKEGYPLAFQGSFTGAYEPLKFQGDLDVQIELTSVNTNARVDLPAACNNPISR